jgi:hypothetical protein
MYIYTTFGNYKELNNNLHYTSPDREQNLIENFIVVSKLNIKVGNANKAGNANNKAANINNKTNNTINKVGRVGNASNKVGNASNIVGNASNKVGNTSNKVGNTSNKVGSMELQGAFIRPSKTKSKTEKVYSIQPDYEFKSDTNLYSEIIDCLVLPTKIIDQQSKNNYITSVKDHGYEVILNNYKLNKYSAEPTNIIYIDGLNYNFFSIINTNLLVPNGVIKLLDTNKKQSLIKLNDNCINKPKTTDMNNFTCRDFDTTDDHMYNYSNDPVRAIQYTGNPKILIYGDIVPCDKTKTNPYIYIYFKYDDTEVCKCNSNSALECQIIKLCKNKLNFTTLTLGDVNLNSNNHGFIFNEFLKRDFVIIFNPINDAPNGFTTIINTNGNLNSSVDIEENKTVGNIKIDPDINDKLMKKYRYKINFNFYVATINLSKLNKTSISNRSGPYNSISFTGNPQIIIYIPPFVLPSDSSSPQPDYTFQSDPTICDIYVNMIY